MTDRPGAVDEAVAAPVPVEQLQRGLPTGADAGATRVNTMIYAGLATIGVLVSSVPVAYALARLRWRGRDAVVPARAGRDDAAAAGDDRAALRDVSRSCTWSGTLCAADPAQLVRRRVLDLPAAPVLPDDPGGLPRRRARRRLRRVPHPASRSSCRLAKPGDRGGRAVHRSSTRWNDFFGPLLYAGENHATTGRCRSASPSSARCYQVQWNLTMAATLLFMAAGHPAVLRRAEGVRRGRHADGGQGMKVAVIGGGLDVHARAGVRARPSATASTSTSSRCTTSTPSGARSSAGWPADARRAQARRRA